MNRYFLTIGRITLGYILTAVSIVIIAGMFLLLSWLAGLSQFMSTEITDQISRWGIEVPLLTGLLLLIIGFMLKEGKKMAVLFLRPFNSFTNEFAMRSIAGEIGNKFTAIALDDGAIPSPKTTWKESLVGVFLLLPTGLSLLVISILAHPLGMDECTILRHEAVLSFKTLSTMDNIKCMSGVQLPVWTATYIGLLTIVKAFRSVFPTSNKIEVHDLKKIKRVVYRVVAASSWWPRLLSPRSIVVHTKTNIWQMVVSELGKKCDIVIIDLSKISSSTDWELEYLQENKADKYVIMLKDGTALPFSLEHICAPIVRYNGDPNDDKYFAAKLKLTLSNL